MANPFVSPIKSIGANSVFFPITHTKRAKKHMRELEIKNFSSD